MQFEAHEPQFTLEELEAVKEEAEELHSRVILGERLPDVVPAVVYAREVGRSFLAEFKAEGLGDLVEKSNADRRESIAANEESSRKTQERFASIGAQVDGYLQREKDRLLDVALAKRLLDLAAERSPEVESLIQGAVGLLTGPTDDLRSAALAILGD